mmetsp:Transcript_706/g.2132  ORF Transcript_706/g.2132 Transcript_706/m.2132 type:complete len:332 (+) Transcript_706:145-1140(+)
MFSRCVATADAANASGLSASSTPLTTSRSARTPDSSRLRFRSQVSASDSSVGAATMTNSQPPGFLRMASSANASSCSSRTRSRASATAASALPPPPPSPPSAAATSGFRVSRSRAAMDRSAKSSSNSGSASKRRVCPVGAVSRTMRSHFFERTSVRTSSRPASSSRPGGAVSNASARSASPAAVSPRFRKRSPRPSRKKPAAFAADASASTSSAASRPMGASTSMTCPPCIAASSASPSECAGSVDTTIVSKPASAHATPSAAATVVFPTPPLPPHTRSRGAGSSFRSFHESSENAVAPKNFSPKTPVSSWPPVANGASVVATSDRGGIAK